MKSRIHPKLIDELLKGCRTIDFGIGWGSYFRIVELQGRTGYWVDVGNFWCIYKHNL